MIPLTKKQKRVLDFYTQYYETHEVMPTLQEASDAIGAGRSTIRVHLVELEKRGRLVIKNGTRRGIVLLAKK